MEAVEILLLQIGVILLLSRLLGAGMRWIHQPQVVGEMIAGIMLGPSLLGLIHHGAWMNALFPESSQGNLNILSQLGVMMFMFLVGLELDPKLLRGQGKAAMVIGSFGIIIPFISGVLLGLMLIFTQPAVTGVVSSPLVFCLFIGAAMSLTAFPVLARILTERNLHKTKTGVLALTCAAMNDVMGWCILAFVLAVARMAGTSAAGHASAVQSALLTVLFSLLFMAAMIFVVRRLLGRLRTHFDVRGYLSQNVLATVFMLLFACSLATAAIGIHQIFGAFMLGAVMPKEGRFIKHLSEKVEDFTLLVLLPLFFAYTGLHTEIAALNTPGLWLICGLILAVAVAGKYFGVALAARWFGMSWRQSSLLGVLMNTRGLMELIILNIARSMGLLSPKLFAMSVVMAVVTTLMTTPLMRVLYSPARQKRELEESARDEAEEVAGVHVLVPVSNSATAGALVRMGRMLIADDPGRLYALHLDRPEEVVVRARSALSESDAVLEVAQRAARQYHVPINAVSFVSRNIGRDIADAASRYRASWVVMGWHQPVFVSSVLGATVGQVIRQAPANVAIFVDKGLSEIQRIVVPYLGEAQGRGALLAADRLGRQPGVRVTVLHVVKPNRSDGDAHLSVQTTVDQELPATAAMASVRLQVVESDSPIDLVVEESRRYDLMILGLSAEWNLQDVSIFGKQETVAQRSHCSLLIVHANPLAPVVKTAKAAHQPAVMEQPVGV